MSLTGPDFWPVEHGVVLVTAAGETCFYCGGQLADPAVTWHGSTGAIWLHVGCVMDLFVRLLRDVHQFQIHTGHRFGATENVSR